jgi:hypothetical protein
VPKPWTSAPDVPRLRAIEEAARAYVRAERAHDKEVRAPEWEWRGRNGARHQADVQQLWYAKQEALARLARLLDGED